MTERTRVSDAASESPSPRQLSSVAYWRSHVAETESGCLVWQRRIDRNGYARLGGQWAHRAVYEHEVGPIPDRHELDHLCENPPCVNPAHLDPVTKAEHVARTQRRLGKDDLHQSAAYMRTLGMTYGEIAEALGYQGKESAHQAVKAAIRKGLVDPDAVPAFEPLGEQDCRDIVELRAMGVPVNDLAQWYGIHPATASRLSRGSRTGSEVA